MDQLLALEIGRLLDRSRRHLCFTKIIAIIISVIDLGNESRSVCLHFPLISAILVQNLHLILRDRAKAILRSLVCRFPLKLGILALLYILHIYSSHLAVHFLFLFVDLTAFVLQQLGLAARRAVSANVDLTFIVRLDFKVALLPGGAAFWHQLEALRQHRVQKGGLVQEKVPTMTLVVILSPDMLWETTRSRGGRLVQRGVR